MTNADFLNYLREKLAASQAQAKDTKLPKSEQAQAKIAVKLISDFIKIMENCAGQAARRVKRDYLRRLVKAGIKL